MLRIALLGLLLAGCGAKDGASRYLADARFRRARLVASLVNPANGYSQLRLSHYATGDAADWDRLPEWNPPVATLDDGGSVGADERALDLDSPTLGADAFFRYPVQLLPDATAPSGALVSARLADGSRGVAMTCATCHSRIVDGARVAGLANETLDLGWGPGRVDVSGPADEPIAIPDVRATALESYLQRDGTVRNDAGDLVTLAIRIETLVITSHAGAIRPPRAVSWALAEFLASLAPPLAPAPPPQDPAARGADLFAAGCAACHQPPTYAGGIVPLDVIGTDPRVGQSVDRGTGGYRVPSLRGVATRGRLLHDGSIADLPALFDPARTVAGHRFGLALTAGDRDALLAFLATL